MNEETGLQEFNENLGRLKGVFEEYDSTDQSLERFNSFTEDIEDVFEELVTENEELRNRLGYRKEQGEVYQEIIEDMAEKIDELEEGDEVDFDIDYLLDGIESLFDEYLPDESDTGRNQFNGNFKSPTFNFGVQNPQSDTGNYMSPTFNFSSMPSGSSDVSGRTNIRPSWDDYNWGDGWSDTGEAKFDTPWDYAKTTGGVKGSASSGGWPSIEVNYEGEDDYQVVFDGSEADLHNFDSTWDEAAS